MFSLRLPLLLVALLAAAPVMPSTRADDVRWQDVTAATGADAIGPRQQFGLAAAPDGTIYLYGGADPSGQALGDLWRLPPGGRWERVAFAADSAPPELIEPHLAVDAAGHLYEFGGIDQQHVHRDGLYRFDPLLGDWHRLAAAPAPPPREDHGLVYEPVGDDLYVFGGEAADYSRLNDFWRYDIADDRWEELTASSGADAILGRELYNLSQDGRGHLYLFGGTVDGTDSYARRLNDFWRYDVASGRWENLTVPTGAARVPGRHYYGQACDAGGNFYVLGGYLTPESNAEAGASAGDFWVFRADLGRWQNLTPLAAPLLPRTPYGLVLDPRDGALVAVGGATIDQGVVTYHQDAWRWAPTLGQAPPDTSPIRIGPDGGEVEVLPGRGWLDVPVGALAAETEVEAVPLPSEPVAPPLATFAAVEIRLGAAPIRPLVLTVRRDGFGPADLYRRAVGGGWVSLGPAHVASDGVTLRAEIALSGAYALVAAPRQPLLLPLLGKR